jgi:hypothetical protein
MFVPALIIIPILSTSMSRPVSAEGMLTPTKAEAVYVQVLNYCQRAATRLAIHSGKGMEQ